VHRLVNDDLLKQVGRGVPIDANDLQEAGVEPRRQQMTEVPINGIELALLAFQFQ
jgi:hypothetical protein